MALILLPQSGSSGSVMPWSMKKVNRLRMLMRNMGIMMVQKLRTGRLKVATTTCMKLKFIVVSCELANFCLITVASSISCISSSSRYLSAFSSNSFFFFCWLCFLLKTGGRLTFISQERVLWGILRKVYSVRVSDGDISQKPTARSSEKLTGLAFLGSMNLKQMQVRGSDSLTASTVSFLSSRVSSRQYFSYGDQNTSPMASVPKLFLKVNSRVHASGSCSISILTSSLLSRIFSLPARWTTILVFMASMRCWGSLPQQQVSLRMALISAAISWMSIQMRLSTYSLAQTGTLISSTVL